MREQLDVTAPSSSLLCGDTNDTVASKGPTQLFKACRDPRSMRKRGWVLARHEKRKKVSWRSPTLRSRGAGKS